MKDAQSGLDKLKLEEAQNNLKIGDNWSKPIWPTLVGKYRALADELEQDEKYGSREEVRAVAEASRAEALRVEKYVDLRRRADQSVKQARKEWAERFATEVEKKRQAFDEAVKNRDFGKAARLVAPDALDGIVKTYLEKQVVDVLPDAMSAADRAQFEDTLLLKEDEHIQPVLAKSLPGDPVGAALRAQLATQATQWYREFEKKVQDLLAKRTQEDLAAARAQVEALQAALAGAGAPGAGEIGTLLTGFADQADGLLTTVQEAEVQLRRWSSSTTRTSTGSSCRRCAPPRVSSSASGSTTR